MGESTRLDQTSQHIESRISFVEDDYIVEKQEDKGEAIWVASLSDGRQVFKDDGRYKGINQQDSAWLRLKYFLKDSSLKIVSLGLKFRSRKMYDILPKNAEGYYFRNKITIDLNDSHCETFFLIGSVKDQQLIVQEWNVPSLILISEQKRELDIKDISLIT